MKKSELILSLVLLILIIIAFDIEMSSIRHDLRHQAISKAKTERLLSNTLKELDWYIDKTKEVFGGDFKPGNLRSTIINLSSYNPVEEQCDDTPLVASDNKLVAPGIIALPQHYRELLGFKLGKVVWIPPYGQFIVRDHMHSRKKAGRGDIISFIPEWSKKFGINNMATMYWVESSDES